MCEQCIEIANEIDPKLLQAVMELQPHIDAITSRMAPFLTDSLEMVQIDPDVEVPPHIVEQAKARVDRFAGILGFAYVLGYVLAENSESKDDLAQQAQMAVLYLNRSLNEGNALRYVRANATN